MLDQEINAVAGDNGLKTEKPEVLMTERGLHKSQSTSPDLAQTLFHHPNFLGLRTDHLVEKVQQACSVAPCSLFQFPSQFLPAAGPGTVAVAEGGSFQIVGIVAAAIDVGVASPSDYSSQQHSFEDFDWDHEAASDVFVGSGGEWDS